MSIQQYAQKQIVKTLDTGELASVGSFSTVDHTELRYVRLWFFKHGAEGGSERLRLKVCSDAELSKVLYSSAWANLADAEIADDYWMGWLRFDFEREHINKNLTYYLALETASYTRTADYYLSLVRDWATPIYAIGDSGALPTAMQIYGYEERD